MKRKLFVLLTLLVAVFMVAGTTIALAEEEVIPPAVEEQAPTTEEEPKVETEETEEEVEEEPEVEKEPEAVYPEVYVGDLYTLTIDNVNYALHINGKYACYLRKIGEEKGIDCTYTYAKPLLTLINTDGERIGVYYLNEKELIDVTDIENFVEKVPEEHKENVRKGVDEFYAWIKPYLGYAATFGLGGLIVGIIVFLIVKYAFKKFERNYEAKSMAKAFVEEIGKQDISLDVSAVVDTKLDEIRKALVGDIKPLVDNFGSVQNAVAYLCAAMTNSKVVPDDIRAELSTLAKNLNSEAIAKKKEVVKLQLAKAPTVEKATKETATAEGLFGGYNEKA